MIEIFQPLGVGQKYSSIGCGILGRALRAARLLAEGGFAVLRALRFAFAAGREAGVAGVGFFDFSFLFLGLAGDLAGALEGALLGFLPVLFDGLAAAARLNGLTAAFAFAKDWLSGRSG